MHQPRHSPKVSVNIVTYNRRQMLERCLRSVFQQSFADYEVVVIDDGSTDGTREYMESLSGHPLTYRYHPHTGRLPILRNRALELSRGKYIALLDSDDEWPPLKLERQVAFMEQGNLALTFTDARTFGPGDTSDGSFLRRKPSYYTTHTISRLFKGWFILFPSVMFLRSVLQGSGHFDETLVAVADAEFVLRVISSYPFGLLHEPLMTRHLHDAHHSTRHRLEAYEEMLTLAAKYHSSGALTSGAYRRAISRLLYRMGSDITDDRRRSKDAFARSFLANPLTLRAALRWILP